LKAPVPPGQDLTASLVARSETGLKPLGKKGPTGLMLKRKGRTRRVVKNRSAGSLHRETTTISHITKSKQSSLAPTPRVGRVPIMVGRR
jgi:hypothetical protein